MVALVWIFTGVTLLQILIWGIFPTRLVWRDKSSIPAISENNTLFPNVSVVICARNEAVNLKKFLPAILKQQYPADWEVMVVDDDSSDASEEILAELSKQFSRLQVLRVSPKVNPGKKHALSTGIKMARFDWIALTDADCRPVGPDWLKTMMNEAKKPAVVLGYAPMITQKGWMNRWARFETLYTALQYLSTAHTGWPFMGVGRNLVWHKSLFWRAGGFSAHDHIIGGDDDLFVNEVADHHNTVICTQPASFMFSPAKTTFKGWINQKKRHLNAGIGYKTWHNLVLGGVAFTHAVHYGLAVILLLLAPEYWGAVVVGYSLRIAVVWPVMQKACRMFGEKKMAVFIPVLDGLLAIWVGGLAPFLLLTSKKAQAWK